MDEFSASTGLLVLDASAAASAGEWPVNAALRALGVDRADSPDEATALGLGGFVA